MFASGSQHTLRLGLDPRKSEEKEKQTNLRAEEGRAETEEEWGEREGLQIVKAAAHLQSLAASCFRLAKEVWGFISSARISWALWALTAGFLRCSVLRGS